MKIRTWEFPGYVEYKGNLYFISKGDFDEGGWVDINIRGEEMTKFHTFQEPKYKVGQRVSFTNLYGAGGKGKITHISLSPYLEYTNRGFKRNDDQWLYEVQADDGRIHYRKTEHQLSLVTPQDDLAEELKEKGITFDDKKLQAKSVYYTSSFPITNISGPVDENITVTFMKVK